MKYRDFGELSGWDVRSNSDHSLQFCFENFYEGALNYLRDDVLEDYTAYFIDHHNGCDIPHSKIHPEELLSIVPNKSIIIINWGHYTGTMLEFEPRTNAYLYKKRICNDGVFQMLDSELYNTDREYFTNASKIYNNMLSLYCDDENEKYIFYFLYDSIHNGNDNEIELIDKLVFNIMKKSKNQIFNPIYFKDDDEKSSLLEPTKEFRSIKSACELLKEDKNKIIEEMISKVDIARIMNIVNSHLDFEYCSSYSSKKVVVNKEKIKKWLKKWAENKYEYYLMFGKNFTIQTTVKYEKDVSDFAAQLEELCYKYPQYSLILNCIPTEFFKTNEIMSYNLPSSLLKYFPCPPDGMKLTKYLSKLIVNEQFDIDLSKITQDKYLERSLYISIDPYDYLTSSINKNGWRSCHNYIDGEHSNGSASYMFDEATLVAYLCNDKEYEYKYGTFKFKGNSKNWRQLIYVDTVDNRCIFSRQYPQDYCNDLVAKTTRELLEDKISEFCNIDNMWVRSKNNEIKDHHYAFPYNIAYNDIPHQNTIMIYHKFHKDVTHTMSIGEKVACVCCGEVHEKQNARLICCNECADYRY